MPDLYVAVALYWVCRYRLPSAVVDYASVEC